MAHVTSRGGNALIAYRVNQCLIMENPHKNHGQCLLALQGDTVEVSFDTDEEAPTPAMDEDQHPGGASARTGDDQPPVTASPGSCRRGGHIGAAMEAVSPQESTV